MAEVLPPPQPPHIVLVHVKYTRFAHRNTLRIPSQFELKSQMECGIRHTCLFAWNTAWNTECMPIFAPFRIRYLPCRRPHPKINSLPGGAQAVFQWSPTLFQLSKSDLENHFPTRLKSPPPTVFSSPKNAVRGFVFLNTLFQHNTVNS